MGVLSAAGGGLVKVDSDMNSSHVFHISNVNSSNFRINTITCTNWSNLMDIMIHLTICQVQILLVIVL